MAMLRPDNLFLIFGIILVLLISVNVISFTSKFIFGFGMMKEVDVSRQIYDPDQRVNMSFVCPFSANSHQIQFNRTECFNRTMHHWYIPWMRFIVWRDFRESNERKYKKRLLEFEMAKARERERKNETNAENHIEKPVVTFETPANQKSKEEPSKVVCTILAALLIISSIVAFCEVFRDKCLTKAKTSPTTSKQRFSFGDVSLNDRSPEVLRQEPFQSTSKVTETLVHQTSLDRAFSRLSSEGKMYLRRRK